MAERDVDRIIEQWRDEARAAGESAPSSSDTRATSRALGMVGRIGWLRLAGAAAAVVVFGLIAVPLLGGGATVTVRSEPDAEQASDGAPATDGDAAPVEGAAASGDPAPPAEPVPGAGTEPLPRADSEPAPPELVDTAVERVDDWFAVVAAIDTARGRAYATGEPDGLEAVFVTGGPALASEEASVAALAGAEMRTAGWRTEVLSVRVVEQSDDAAQLEVRDRRGAYDLVDATGAVTAVPQASAARWLMTMLREGGRWLVYEVVPQPGDPADAASTSPPGQP